MAKLAKEKYAEELEAARQHHLKLMKERKELKYKKHYAICRKVALDIVDYACKFGEYRELTGGLALQLGLCCTYINTFSCCFSKISANFHL